MDGPTSYNYDQFKPLKQVQIATVVANDDPKVLGRVKVEIPGLTLGIDKKYLPWTQVMQAPGLGGSMYTSNFAVPQPNTQVMVMFPSEDINASFIFGVMNNRTNMPADQLDMGKDNLHPTSSEAHSSADWDKSDTSAKDQSHFNPNMTEDYPSSHGWVDQAMNWFKINTMKRTVEFCTNSFTKFKNYANGDTVIHITGNLKLVVEKDYYLEVRGNKDEIIFNDSYQHVIGNYVAMTEQLHSIEGKKGIKQSGQNITQN